MRVIEITAPGGPEALALAERAIPQPGPSDVLIRVDAAGVNRPDVLQRMGMYPPPPGASDLPGLEVSGTIAAVGDKVERWKTGNAVCALLTGGGYAEYALAHEGSCLPVPAGVSIEEAAGFPETFFTVWANVFDDAGLRSGETLLVHGGTSGIGVTAILMAKAVGARVIATASSEKKLEAIRKLGADAAFDYTSAEWEKEIQSLGGADVVLDMTGGDFVQRNLDALNFKGRHVSIAFLRGARAEINIMSVMRKQLRLSGSTMKARDMAEKSRLAAGLEAEIWPLVAAGRIRPVIDQIFPLAEAAEAHRRMESGAHIGKILLSTRV
ncbi:MAG: NAD(P)H-quinone oxidoreductase [Parvularculaceae bacterium]|nr:NAD(P)H-quinone oxidoreductase [Parvularculaceae bacterium]